MIIIDIQQAQADLLQYLEKAAQGEMVVVCKENRPIAAIRPVPPYPEGPRPIGLAEGTGEVLPSFFEPLPPDVLAAFEGEET